MQNQKPVSTYKLINPYRLSSFYKSVTDSIRKERNTYKTANAKVAEQAKTITELNNQIKGNENSLATSNSKVNEINFLGISFAKGTYNTIVWTLIIVLALGFAFVTIRSAKNTHEAKYRTGLYEEISQEYQAYKVKANEKEKEISQRITG